MGATSPKKCQKPGCTRTWDRDPTLEVTCPNCGAEPGRLCRRPSGHTVWNPDWPGLPKGIHPERDREALREGAYGKCPSGRCPESLADLPANHDFLNPDSNASAEQGTLADF